MVLQYQLYCDVLAVEQAPESLFGGPNMRRYVISSLTAAASIGFVSSAIAADLPAKAPIYKAPVAVSYNWSGCYLGGYAGGAFSASDANITDNGGGAFTFYNSPAGHNWGVGKGSGFMGGGTVGCNWQNPGTNWVLGVEGELGYLKISRSAVDPVSIGLDTTGKVKTGNWDGVLAVRAGLAFDRALWYLKGGAAFMRSAGSVVDTCNTGTCGVGLINATGSNSYVTWALGTGLEYALINNWSVKGEYLYLGRGPNYTISGIPTAGGGVGTTFNFTANAPAIHTIKVGVNYFFNK